MDDLLFRIKGLLEERQMRGENHSALLEAINLRIAGHDEQIANIRCLKCGANTSIAITIGKAKPYSQKSSVGLPDHHVHTVEPISLEHELKAIPKLENPNDDR